MDNADVYMHSRRIKPNDTFYYNLSTNKMRYWRTRTITIITMQLT
jgi:hypothetical protein